MAKLLYSATISLDGYLAGAGGDMHWLNEHLGPNPQVDELVANIGAILVGRRTYDGDDPHKGTDQEGAFEGTWHGPQFVLTHRPPDDAPPDVTFVEDLESAVAQALAAAGDKYVNILGADVGRQCLEAGLLDEILVCVAPVLLGDGVRFFDHPGGTNVRLEPVSVTPVPFVTNLWFRVRTEA
jgi:dihydrofolate reductase